MKYGARWIVIAGILPAVIACTSSHPSRTALPARSLTPRASFDPGRVATATAKPDAAGPAAAETLAVQALRALTASQLEGELQILVPQQFSASSVLDTLRLGVGDGTPQPDVSAALARLSWSWLLAQDGLSVRAGDYRLWRIWVFAFATDGGASDYVRNPVALPPSLLKSTPQPAAGRQDELPGDAQLRRTPDTIVPLNAPASSLAGERAVVLWRRARYVFAVQEISTPAIPDMATLLALARDLDARVVASRLLTGP